MINKNVLTIALLLMSFLIISNKSFSQQNEKHHKTPEEFATKMSDRMKQNLSLTDDQQKQVYTLMLTKAQERMNNKEKYKNMDKEARKQMKKQNRENFTNQLSGILTPDQMQKFKDNMGKHKRKKMDKKTKE